MFAEEIQMKQYMAKLALIALVALLLVGCAATASEPEMPRLNEPMPPVPGDQAPDAGAVMRGNISEINPTAGGGGDKPLGTIRVEGEKQEDNPFPVAVVYVGDATRIVRQQGGGQIETTFDDLAFGQTVSVTFSGPVRESYPVQIDADEIVILADHPGN